MISVEKPGSPQELVHFGRKGMKWGVRNAYIDKASGQAASYRRVAEGKGSAIDKLRTSGRVSGITIVKAHRSGRSTAEQVAVQQEQHVARMKAGKATISDILRATGQVSMRTIIQGQKRKL